MTITDNEPVVDEALVAKGRELVAGGRLPGKRVLRDHLKTGWPNVNAVLSRLGEEVERETQERRREARAKLRRLPSRKRPLTPSLPIRPRTVIVNEPSTPVAPESPAEVAGPIIPLTIEEHPEPVAEPVNEPPQRKRPVTWPIFLLALPAFGAIWSGWVDLGRLTGFGVVHPLPGIWDSARLNTAITLPIGLETYAAYALYVWLSGQVPAVARRFAKRSAIGSLLLGAAGQVAYHLMVAQGMTAAPWWITTIVACLPVAVLGMGAALRHLVHADERSN